MANYIQAYISTYNAAQQGGISTSLMFSFAITQELQAELPIQIFVSANLSLPAEIRIFRSADGGANYETIGRMREIFPSIADGAASHTLRRIIILDNGQYNILVLTNTGTAATFSVQLLTARLLTAFE